MEFDFIIVGAGSAGCAIANRLSANPKNRVLLLEAGGKDSSPWIHIPVGYFKTMGNPKTDWMFSTENDPGLNGRSIKYPRGKVLGGSSSINGLLYVRGQPEDFDGWRQMGCTGWGWDDVLPYFKRSESWEDGGSDIRGGDGPLSVTKTRLSRSAVDAWVDAAVAAGYKRTDDYNQPDQEGVGYFQLTAKDGRRCSSAVAYLKPARDRANLKVVVNALTEKVEIVDGRAIAVHARVNGRSTRFAAAKEVVLSAGAINSPQILMLSGVGDGEVLQSHGIETLVDNPHVGRNLQDHLQARPVYKVNAQTINTEAGNIFRQAMMAVQYALTRNGPMTMAASLGTAFLKTRPELATPDIQFHIQPFSADSPAEGPHKFDAFTASVLQMRPESAGHIELKSADPATPVGIHPNYLATKTDCDTIVAGIQIARKIAEFDPLKSMVTEEHSPGPGVAFDDYDATLNWARDTAVTIYHPTGTCKMGTDEAAVIDPRLRVKGVKGLRVADASIMPIITSGNTNAPCIMIGEKAADMILEDAAA